MVIVVPMVVVATGGAMATIVAEETSSCRWLLTREKREQVKSKASP